MLVGLQKNSTTRLYVTYELHHPYWSEVEIVEVISHDVDEAVKKAPNTANCFSFHEREETVRIIDNERVVELSDPMNHSGRHFIDGVLLDEHHLNETGYAGHDPGTVIRTRYRTYAPFKQGRDRMVRI